MSLLPKTFASSIEKNHWNEGAPGCWDEIRTAALTTVELNQLRPDCQDLRADYLALVRSANDHPADSLKKLITVLKAAKKAEPPYEAILFSALSTAPEVEEALQDRASVERKLKVPFRYADAALFHFQGNRCEDHEEFRHPFYREVCTAKDSLLSSRLTTLNPDARAKAKK